jgi:hypothetical protein
MASGFQPHEALPAEPTFDRFVTSVGGVRVASLVGQNPKFLNADYFFRAASVLVELKTIEEDFPRLPEYQEKLSKLRADQVRRGLATWGGLVRMESPSPEATNEIVRLYRPRLNRMLDKANGQIKGTRAALCAPDAAGLVIVANDQLTSLEPVFVIHLLANILLSRFSAIDGFVYVTLNQYVDIPGSDLAHLLWVPLYSERVADTLVAFVDELGRSWFRFLENEIGPCQGRIESPDRDILVGSKMVRQPPKGDAG